MQRLLLKILLYFLSNYALIGASYSNAQADVGQTKALLETRELIELGKYEKARYHHLAIEENLETLNGDI